jgi:MiaB-like tRNA modifying enzyme
MLKNMHKNSKYQVGNILLQSFYSESYGCTANTAASELMRQLLLECGFRKSSSFAQADFILVNTCIVKAPTEAKIKHLLLQYGQQKPIIIAGCLPQVMIGWCQKELPNAALIGVDNFHLVCEAAKKALAGKKFVAIGHNPSFYTSLERDRKRKITGIIEISKGCTGQCAYCIVRIAKGPLVSKPPELVLNEAKKALAEGCKELWLTAQDTASYGEDFQYSLPKLVKDLSLLSKGFFIRIGMMNADHALAELSGLQEIYQLPNVYSFAHIPLQSGSNRILQLMNRRYTIDEFKYLINQLRSVCHLTLSTDIITGFPGETKKDHELTKQVLGEITFDVVNLSKYGDRPGTEASKAENKLPTEIIKARSKELTTLIHKMTLEKNKQWIGWQGEALAVARNQKQQLTLLRNRAYKLIAVKNDSLEIGKKHNVKIEEALKTRLLASII